jgi:hypothetical protein
VSCGEVGRAKGMRDNDVCKDVRSWEDDLQIRTYTGASEQTTGLRDSRATRILDMCSERAEDGIVSGVDLASLVHMAGKVMPLVLGDGIRHSTRWALTREGVGVWWKSKVQTSSDLVVWVCEGSQ